MRKKWLFILFVVLGIVISAVVLLSASPPITYCAFCDPLVLHRQTFYEDEQVYALYTHKPVVPGHCLVLPKRHIERWEGLTDAEIVHIGRVLKLVNLAVSQVYGTTSYLLLQKNGREAGQSVPHVHVHYLPKKPGDASSLRFMIKMYIANLKKPVSVEKLHQEVEKLRRAMESQSISLANA